MSTKLDELAQALLKKDPLETPVVDTIGVQTLVRGLRRRQRELEALVEQRSAEIGDKAEAVLRESEERFRSTVNNLLVGVVVHAADLSVVFNNSQACYLLGLSPEQMLGSEPIDPGWQFINEDLSALKFSDYPVNRVIATGESFAYDCMGVRQPGRADITWLTGSAIPVFTRDNVLDQIVVNFMDVTELKRLQQALQKRVLALTHPLDEPEGIVFDDLFNLSEIQRIQDEFSRATGVAAIITDSQGCPLTEPSNFVELCRYLVNTTGKANETCFTANAVIRTHHPEGPVIRQCQSSGLWDAGATIAIDGRHVATWLIGQVREESWTEEQVRAHARAAGADERAVLEAFPRVPVMTQKHFEGIAHALFTLATQLSTSAYQNVQQARFIEDQRRAEQALLESEEKYRKLFESESDAIIIFDGQTRRIVDVNDAAIQLYGYTRDEFLQLTYGLVTAHPEAVEEFVAAILAETVPAFLSQHRKKSGVLFPTEITGFSFSLQGRVVICGVVRDSTERVAYEAEREKNQEELRKLASELSLAEQREREQIARELHDSVSQLLSSTLLRLNLLKDSSLPDAAADSLDTVCGIVREALDETRSLTFELSCPLLNELGLAAALEELCSSMTHEYSIRFDFSGIATHLPISMDRKIGLYRSARELLINVIKHSGASWACVDLGVIDDFAFITVRDDGVGLDADMAGKGFSPTGGFGLFNISEYIRHAGGSLQIESVRGKGTEVVLRVPLEDVHG